MKKIILSVVALATASVAMAQTPQDSTSVGQWTKGGNIALTFNQAAFNSKWQGGGTNNLAANLAVSYAFNYKKNDWTWDNNLYVDYGITRLQGDEFSRKTTDRLEYNSILGKQATEYWYYSVFMNFKTQFTKGYEYDTSTTPTQRTVMNKFFSPAYLQVGPGMLWKKSDNLRVNFAPATSKFTFVSKYFTGEPGYVDGAHYGVDANKTMRYELGMAISGYAKFNLMENVSMENILNLYSNYLEDPQNVDVDYTANIVMTINKFLSANFTFQAIYDDNAARGLQVRELFGLGLNYKLQ
ncbi:MAG: DUF3078 domain-containing protein [Capnocytophaga sp.]|nr:DUF3078 domain-containing protein [Capnocytophaga sp.]